MVTEVWSSFCGWTVLIQSCGGEQIVGLTENHDLLI